MDIWREKKTVRVRSYMRFRLGNWESVVQHWRSSPNR